MNSVTQECCCHFAAQYEQASHPAFRELERSVLGCDYGGTSWTTRSQADLISAPLRLDEGVHMLELGSGAGWPCIYLADQSGCDLTLLDLPVNALKQARERSVGEGLSVGAVSASGAQLPFASASFDAIGHSDVLCCLPEKRKMLEECRRVARPGARMLFYVIAPGEGLGAGERSEAIETGPPFVGLDGDYAGLLLASGWNQLETESLSAQYLQSLQRMVSGLESNAATFRELMEPGEFEETVQHRRHQADAVERGLLVRESYLAEAI